MSTVNKHAIASELKRDSSLALTACKRFGADQCTTLAASIAFYSAFSLAPTLLMVLAVAGWFFGAEAARGQLFAQVHNFLGNEPAAAIQAIVENAHRQGGGGFAAVTSVVLLIIGASATFSSLNTALDVVFPGRPSEKRTGIAVMVRVRLVSFGLVLGVAFLLIVSLVLDTAVVFVGKMLWGNSPFVIVGDILQMIISLVILALAFTALMKLLPDAYVRWRDAAVGGVVSAVLFTIGKKLFALYLAHAGTASAFGAAGSLAVLLMWLYFSSAVLLLGAEFAAVKGGFSARKDAAAAAMAAAHEQVATRFAKDGKADVAGNAAAHGSRFHVAGGFPDVAGTVADRVAMLVPAALRGDEKSSSKKANNEPIHAEAISPPTTATTATTAKALTSTAATAAEAAANEATAAATNASTNASKNAVTSAASKVASASSEVKKAAAPSGTLMERSRREAWNRLDAAIARSRHPVVFRLAAHSAPAVFQGLSVIVGLLGRRRRRQIASAPVGGTRLALRPNAPLSSKQAPAVKSKTTGSPIMTAVFAAGAGLLLATLANRDKPD